MYSEKIDFDDIARQTGMRSGKVCRSKTFGWVVVNDKPMMAIIEPPLRNGQEPVKIVDNCWLFKE